ncbi:CvpA family protein [Cucumibacter marinus]|uniref:CvpA family protein n=1 Tax=Cucumibacter marinus TaxID=1121252 RepID=UPI00040B860A|nr:CvpA family protein [Cucumibacter marinus]
MLTAFDIAAGVLILISALLATTRGATREILSLVSWAGAGIFAIWVWQNYPEIAREYVADELLADIVTIAVSFLVALIILHLITMRIADFVVDSKIGPLDRTLGFVFGAVRGLLIVLVFIVFVNWLFPSLLDDYAADSRSLPTLERMADDLISALPDDMEKAVNDFLSRSTAPEPGADVPIDQGTDALENELPPEETTT